MDLEKIHKTWSDFSSKYNLELNDNDQHLIFVPNKKQTYSTVEIQNDIKIFYRYIFYKLDVINVGNYFRIAIPIETKIHFSISKPDILKRTIKNIYIYISTDSIEFDKDIQEDIIIILRKFNDLKIALRKVDVYSDDQIEFNTDILELTTKQLPQDIKQIEELRELNIKVLNQLIKMKIAKPASNTRYIL